MMSCGECGAVVEDANTPLHKEHHREVFRAIMTASDLYDEEQVNELADACTNKVQFHALEERI